MTTIWGNSPRGRDKAYKWLREKTGKVIHFRDISDPNELGIIRDMLFSEMMRRAKQDVSLSDYELMNFK